MKTFIKRMRNNYSYFPSEHIEPIQILENMNHPMIPKFISYDDESYTSEFIEGVSLGTYVRSSRDPAFGLRVIKDINNFMYNLSEYTKPFKAHWGIIDCQMSCDDIHEGNMLVTKDGRPYIIDFDQFGFFHQNDIFKLLQSANMRLCDSIRSSLLIATSDSHLKMVKARDFRIKELEDRLLSLV